MFKDITLGQYIQGNSVIHKLDARIKIILTLIYITVLFMIKTPVGYLLYIIATVTVIAISGVPYKYLLKGLRPMMFIIIFTVLINLFLTPGEAAVSAKISGITFKITYQGIKISIMMFLRLTLLITGTSILTLTTSPMMLTDGIELLLKPFDVIKVPSHEIAMMMSIAIRFIPTLSQEADKIMKAQMARGADFESGNIINRAKAMIPILVPLFVSAFRRADELATAMDSRCYNGGQHRTRMKQMKIVKRDYIAVVAVILFTVVVFVAEKLL